MNFFVFKLRSASLLKLLSKDLILKCWSESKSFFSKDKIRSNFKPILKSFYRA